MLLQSAPSKAVMDQNTIQKHLYTRVKKLFAQDPYLENEPDVFKKTIDSCILEYGECMDIDAFKIAYSALAYNELVTKVKLSEILFATLLRINAAYSFSSMVSHAVTDNCMVTNISMYDGSRTAVPMRLWRL